MSQSGNKDFLGKEAPIGYVAGLGRGARGFTTSADHGPGKVINTEYKPGESVDVKKAAEEARRALLNQNDEGLLGSQSLDKEDQEADMIYAQVEERMRQKKKRKMEVDTQLPDKNSKAKQQFQDLKSDLQKLSADDWANIPDAVDLVSVGKKTKRGRERDKEKSYFTSAGDFILDSARNKLKEETYAQDLDDQEEDANRLRDDLLRAKLDLVGKDNSKQEEQNQTQDYLNNLNDYLIKQQTELGDLKRARELLRSVIQTNPDHAQGWIAAARVEEMDGKLPKARQVLQQACQKCSDNEDVWLELIRISKHDDVKLVIGQALKHLKKSAKIWIQAIKAEKDIISKRKLVKVALENVPSSEQLWKTAIELEDDEEDIKLLLSKAVKCVPNVVDFWLQLSRLESYDNAQKIINAARIANPQSVDIWIAAAKLQEDNGKIELISQILIKAVQKLSQTGINLSRNEWIDHAEKAFASGHLQTGQLLINITSGIDLQETERLDTWLNDIDILIEKQQINSARAILTYSLQCYPDDARVWIKAIDFETLHGSEQSLKEFFSLACSRNPLNESIWVKSAEYFKSKGLIDESRRTVQSAFQHLSKSISLWSFAIDLEISQRQFQKALILLTKAREVTNVSEFWVKSIKLLNNLQMLDEMNKILDQALNLFKDVDQLYLYKIQHLKRMNDVSLIQETFTYGLKNCPQSEELWISYSEFQANLGNTMKARAILDQARQIMPQSPLMYLKSVQLEIQNQNKVAGLSILESGLKACNQSGVLWALAIQLEPRATKKAKSADAIKHCENDPYVLVAVASWMWQERNIEKARTWFKKALNSPNGKSNGDIWAQYYLFEKQHSTQPDRVIKEISDEIQGLNITEGEIWQKISSIPEYWLKSKNEILLIVANHYQNNIR